MAPHASLWVTVGIPTLALAVALLALAAVRRAAPTRLLPFAAGLGAWALVWGALAGSGVLGQFDRRPPPFLFLLPSVLVACVLLARSRLGAALARLPLWTLVAVQAFRLPLELLLARAASDGVAPPEMTLHGYNFDILTGLSAIAVAWVVRRRPAPLLVGAFSALGLTLLTVVLVIAVAGTPMLHAFGGGAHLNTWVAWFPFVYLPTVLVPMALVTHLVTLRALALQPGGLPAPRHA